MKKRRKEKLTFVPYWSLHNIVTKYASQCDDVERLQLGLDAHDSTHQNKIVVADELQRALYL